MSPSGDAAGRSESLPLWAFVGYGVLFLCVRGLLELPLSPWLRVLLSLLPVIPFAWFLVMVIRGIGEMDELEQRIHLEALAVAYPVAMLLLMTLDLLDIAIHPREDGVASHPSLLEHIWPVMIALYFFGLARARRRYQ
jgi:hypothetical protein